MRTGNHDGSILSYQLPANQVRHRHQLHFLIQGIFQLLVSTAHRIANHHHIRLHTLQIISTEPAEIPDMMFIKVGTHGRVESRIGARNGMAKVRKRNSHRSHCRTANTNEIKRAHDQVFTRFPNRIPIYTKNSPKSWGHS